MSARDPATGGAAGLDDAGWRQLCRSIRAGDEQAFATFYDLWFARALQLARAVTRGDEAMGLDVVQDVMLKVVHRLPALAGERAVAAWMAKTVSTAAIDRSRSELRRRRRETAVAERLGTEVGGDALQRSADGEQFSWLRAQLAGMSPDERFLLQQRFLAEQSLGDVARSLGLSADAAHGRIRRLVQRLQRAAQEWFGDD